MHAAEGSVTALSWPVELLSGEVYFDLFDMLKDKDCQFSCTDKNMSIDPRNTGGKTPNKTPSAKFIIVELVKHLASSRIWHVFGWNIKSRGFKTTFFFYVFSVFAFHAYLLTQFLAGLCCLCCTRAAGCLWPHSFLNFCCCLCIASYFCRCLQFYIHLKITPRSPCLHPSIVPSPSLFSFTIALNTIKDHWFPLAIPFPTTHWYFNLDSIEKADLQI